MKQLLRFALVAIVTGIVTPVFPGNIDLMPGRENGSRIIENTYTTLRLENNIASITTFEVLTEQGSFTKLVIPGYSKTSLTGSPELPVWRRLIEIPLGASMEVAVEESEFKDVVLADAGYVLPVMPAQPPAAKNLDRVPFIIDHEAYKVNAFYPAGVAGGEILGIMRSVRIGRVDIFPVQYNPATHTLRVYTRIVIRVSFKGADVDATVSLKAKYENPYFRATSKSLINYRSMGSKDTVMKNPITYVIVSDRMFESQLQPFIEWKTKKGFNVIEAYTDQPNVGSTTYSIKTFIQGLYNSEDPPPSFVLFVGDVNQVPAWNGNAGSHVTDLYYCEYTGDLFPEIYYGRFSAQNPSQLQPQVDKTLMYEQYLMPDPAYLNEVVMVAGMDGSFGAIHGNGQILYGTENYFNETNGIYSHTFLYPESGSLAAQMRSDINDGVCYANYTAHGSSSGWADPEFSIGHIAAMDNYGKYALLVGNCCQTSMYDVSECFAEALLRAEDKGSLGYIGASNNSYWDEDYYWGVGVGPISGDPPSYEQTTLGAYDRTFHTHGEPYGEWYMTMDQMVFAGNLAVTEGAPGSAEYYWEMYCLMGDPSLMVYYSEPPETGVSHLPLLPLGTTTFIVDTEPYAYVALSKDGILHGAIQADESGHAELEIIPVTMPGMADIVVTRQNGRPYITQIPAANPDGPFIIVNEATTTELSGYVNNKLECNEVIAINLELINYGNSDGNPVMAQLQTADPYITVADGSEDCGLVPANSMLTIEKAFTIIIDDFFPDGHEVEFVVTTSTPSRENWQTGISFTLSAPVFNMVSMAINDAEEGNGNGRLDPGETAEVVATFGNSGHSVARNTIGTLEACSGFITVENPVENIGNLSFFGNTPVTYTVSVNDKAADGIVADLIFGLSSGAFSFSETCVTRLGLVSEDFETGDLSKFEWQQEGNQTWTISTVYPYAGIFSAKSGAITDGQSSGIAVTYRTMGADSISFIRKVSSETDDVLRFYINNTLMGSWSGTVGGWRREAFPVAAGNHTFKWVYVKNSAGSGGADAAWLDDIVFPAPVATTLWAGSDAVICGSETHHLFGTATEYDAVSWSTQGDGSFSNNNILDPVYTPGPDDIAAGGVVLALTVTDGEDGVYDDDLLLTLRHTPETPGMPAGPDLVDLDETVVSAYTCTSAEGVDEYHWSVSPAEAGIIVSAGPEMTMVWDRQFAGTAMISVAGFNDCGEGNYAEALEVIVDNSAVGLNEPVVSGWSVSVYPNPAGQEVFLRLSTGEKLTARIRIISLTGMVLMDEMRVIEGGGASEAIQVQNFPAGLYLLRVDTQRGCAGTKLVVR